MFSILRDYYRDKQELVPRNSEEEEVVEGKIVIITGANSGLGKATALELAKKGATIILACRDMKKAAKAVDEISLKCSNGRLIPMHLDLASLASVENFATRFTEDFENLHILINNAGIADQGGVLKKTVDGFEQHMGVNHLGHFRLTTLLLPVLRKSCPSRIVCVSSTLHLTANLDISNLFLENSCPNNSRNDKPYGNSKLANALFAKELATRLGKNGITSYSLCPGIVDTSILRSDSPISNTISKLVLKIFGQSPRKGCETILYCALSRRCAEESGKMYRFGRVWESATEDLDSTKSRQLWDKSEHIIQTSSNLNRYHLS